MAIKSLEDLKKIRDASKKKVDLREKGESTDNMVEILVGMATCGIAAGGRETMKALNEAIEEANLDNVRVIQVDAWDIVIQNRLFKLICREENRCYMGMSMLRLPRRLSPSMSSKGIYLTTIS